MSVALPISDDDLFTLVREVLSGVRIVAEQVRRCRERWQRAGGRGLCVSFIDPHFVHVEYMARNGLGWSAPAARVRRSAWTDGLQRLVASGRLARAAGSASRWGFTLATAAAPAAAVGDQLTFALDGPS